MTLSIDAMVDEQVRRWHVLREHRKHEDRVPPVVAISREFGAEGAAIGHKVAEALEFTCWDNEIVHAIAASTGTAERIVEALDEHSRSRLEDIIASLFGTRGPEHEYVRQLHRIVHAIERHGSSVVVGRGSPFMVKPGHALRVRVVMSEKKRIASYARRHEIDEAKAESVVVQTEKDRRAFERQTFDTDPNDPLHYDLVLNRGSFPSLEATAAVVVSAYRASFG